MGEVTAIMVITGGTIVDTIVDTIEGGTMTAGRGGGAASGAAPVIAILRLLHIGRKLFPI